MSLMKKKIEEIEKSLNMASKQFVFGNSKYAFDEILDALNNVNIVLNYLLEERK